MPQEKSNIQDILSAHKKKLGRNLTFDEAMKVWEEYLTPSYEADRRAEQLSAEDYSIIQSAFRTRP